MAAQTQGGASPGARTSSSSTRSASASPLPPPGALDAERAPLLINAPDNKAADEEDSIQTFGYKQELSRSLGVLASFGFAFKFLSPVVGTYTMFGFGLQTAGPLFIWALPVILLGQMLVALVLSDLAVRFPLAGAMYEWARRLLGPRVGWLVGWLYGWGLLITVASANLGAVPYALDIVGQPLDPDNTWLPVVVASAILLLQVLINIFGVRITTYITNAGLFVEVGMTVALGIALLAVPGPRQPWSVFFSSQTYTGVQPLSALLPASLAFAYVFYGFESAAIVSEETLHAAKVVPRSMLLSLLGGGLVTIFLDVALISSIPDLSVATNPSAAENAISYIISSHFGDIALRILSGLLLVAFFSAGAAGQAAAARIIYSYARDDALPGSRWLKIVSPSTQIPTMATVLSGVVPFLVILTNLVAFGELNLNVIIVDYAVVGVNLSFAIIVFARIYSAFASPELFQSPLPDGHFHLGRLGVPIAIVAQLYGVALLLNVLWPRPQPGQPAWTGYLTLIATGAIFVLGLVLNRLLMPDVEKEETKEEQQER